MRKSTKQFNNAVMRCQKCVRWVLPGARTVARKNAESPINEKQSKGETDHFAGKLKFCASPVWRDRKGQIVSCSLYNLLVWYFKTKIIIKVVYYEENKCTNRGWWSEWGKEEEKLPYCRRKFWHYISSMRHMGEEVSWAFWKNSNIKKTFYLTSLTSGLGGCSFLSSGNGGGAELCVEMTC